jgi:hypothetical protein
VFLYTRSDNPGGHPTVNELVLQAGPTHTLWRGRPSPELLHGYRTAARYAPQPQCSVVRCGETGLEHSFGHWWPYPLRRLERSMAAGWRDRTWTVHTWSTGENLSIGWAPAHGTISLTFEYGPGQASEVDIRVPLPGAFDGTLETLIATRGLPVLSPAQVSS